jgi:hypothetical protein
MDDRETGGMGVNGQYGRRTPTEESVAVTGKPPRGKFDSAGANIVQVSTNIHTCQPLLECSNRYLLMDGLWIAPQQKVRAGLGVLHEGSGGFAEGAELGGHY